MTDGVTRTALDLETAERFQWLAKELGVRGFGLSLMRLRPGQRGRIHRHRRQEEVYVVLAGTLTVATADAEVVLGPHEVLRVGPEIRRQLSNRGREPVVLLAMGAAGTHEGADGLAYPAFDAPEDEGRPARQVPLPDDLPVD